MTHDLIWQAGMLWLPKVKTKDACVLLNSSWHQPCSSCSARNAPLAPPCILHHCAEIYISMEKRALPISITIACLIWFKLYFRAAALVKIRSVPFQKTLSRIVSSNRTQFIFCQLPLSSNARTPDWQLFPRVLQHYKTTKTVYVY